MPHSSNSPTTSDTYIHYREHKVLLFFCYRAVVAAERDIPPIREM
jgi:hypothetical protein